MQRFLALIFIFPLLFNAQIQQVDLDYYLPKDVTYNPNIPTPKSILGHEVGEWHITHDKLVTYMYAIAKTSDRISIENRGYTYEGRPLILLTITSAQNHLNLETIRQNHLNLSNPNSGSVDITNMPVVINQGFSIHGNEPSGSNAALALVYYLAAAQGTKIENILEKAVILLDPSFNPDGLQRFASWVNMHKSENINPDPNDREYSESWPGARTNHYWFDMNRDWLPVQHPDSRVRIETYHKWYPNILTDHHEMGTNSTFFFQPGIPSRTHPLTPDKNQILTGEIAEFHAAALDQIGSFYYAEEDFDDFYYGKGSTFPDINGGIGILFEQASSRGHAQESVNGVLSFPFTIRNQFVTALSTIDAGVALREKLLNYQRQFFQDAFNEAQNGAIVFGNEKDAATAYHLAEILQLHKIKVYTNKNDFTLDGKTYKKDFSYIIPKKQRQSRLINAIFEKRTKFKDSLFYDVSAWTFPLAFNLDYNENAPVAQLGSELNQIELREISTIKASNYAYLMEWHEYYSPKALYQILEKGIRVKVAMKTFEMNGKTFDYGTIMIPVQNQILNAEKLAELLNNVARESHLDIFPVNTGLTQGIDLGSNNFKDIKKPVVAVITGDGITPSDAGEIWHLFDQRYKMIITKLDTRNFSRVNLNRYTHIILPNTWGSAFSKNDTEKIKAWINDGGILIGYKNAGQWLKNNSLLNVEFKQLSDTASGVSFENKRDYAGAKRIGGAIFQTNIDRSHPVNFGIKNDKLPVFKNSNLILEPDNQSYNNPILFSSSPLLSGYIHPDILKDLGETSVFQTSNHGRGKVIYFLENTNFRAFWFGTNKLLMNAVFFGNQM